MLLNPAEKLPDGLRNYATQQYGNAGLYFRQEKEIYVSPHKKIDVHG